jgi:pimeloyl-ACP methyl ester carboxylesterase
MPEKRIVLGGWGVRPEILKTCFGDTAVYLDVNDLMPFMISRDSLEPDWKEILSSRIKPFCDARDLVLCGWSTGAIVAYAMAELLQPKKMVLISATPSFCCREGWRTGHKQALLASMRKSLQKNRNLTLDDFYRQCGAVIPDSSRPKCPNSSLIAGLWFLEHLDLRPVAPVPCETIFLHGTDDAIVPCAAGNYFSGAAGGNWFSFPGGHAFFTENSREISHLLKTE